MASSDNPGDLSVLFERAREDSHPLYGVHVTGNSDHDFLLLRRAGGTEIVDLAKYRRSPRSVVADVQFDEIESLLDYVRTHQSETTKAYFDRTAGRVVVVFDDNGRELPEWRRHTAALTLRHTPQWLRWTGKSGKMESQVDFAEFIEEHGVDITEPSYAHMLEIASSLQVSRSGVFKSGMRLGSGEYSFMLTEEHAVKAGVSAVTVPTDIKLSLAPYEGSPTFAVKAKFRYRLHDGELKLGVKLLQTDDIIKVCQTELADQVREFVPVFFGRYK
jgi:uncharacterized protein YfdQ (DUF2303 family)